MLPPISSKEPRYINKSFENLCTAKGRFERDFPPGFDSLCQNPPSGIPPSLNIYVSGRLTVLPLLMFVECKCAHSLTYESRDILTQISSLKRDR